MTHFAAFYVGPSWLRSVYLLQLVSIVLGWQRPALAQQSSPAQADADLLTLERIVSDPPLWGLQIGMSKFSPDGRWLAFSKENKTDSRLLDLWGFQLGQSEREPQLLLRAADFVENERLSEEERMVFERKRVRHRGVVDFHFCGPAWSGLLVRLAGDLYLLHLKKNKPGLQRLTQDGRSKLTPRCSPKGRYVTYVQDNDIRVIDLVTGTKRQLTHGGSRLKTHGVAEFVAQEEMDRELGYFWSQDERFLAYLEVDVSPVGVQRRLSIGSGSRQVVEQRYPKAGQANAVVTLRLLEVDTGRDRLLQTPGEDGYLARVDWSEAGELFVQWQSRDQRRLVLLRGRKTDFQLWPFIEERDAAWVNLHDDLRVLDDGGVIWSSEVSGVNQLYRISQDGKRRTALTHGEEPVVAVIALDRTRRRLYYKKASNRGREHKVYFVELGDHDQEPEEVVFLDQPGCHWLTADRTGRYFVHKHSRLLMPPQVRLIDSQVHELLLLRTSDQHPWDQLAKPIFSWVTLEAADGAVLNGLLLLPLARRADNKLPVIVHVYGGPGGQLVQDAFGKTRALDLYLTQHGFALFRLDNRGSANRERSFTREIKNRFGDVDVRDQLEGIAYLRGLPWVDPERIAVWGWSYGGTLAAMLMMQENSPFRAGISGAPVTDWRNYDTHYTERYLGTPQANAAVYEAASVLNKVKNLSGALLLVHGTSDDNVLFDNTLDLIQVLQEAAKPFELMLYPGQTHVLAGKQVRLHFYRTMVRFLAQEFHMPQLMQPR